MLQFSLSKAYLHKAHQLVVLLEDYDFDQTQKPNLSGNQSKKSIWNLL